jgi:hypothetical protein
LWGAGRRGSCNQSLRTRRYLRCVGHGYAVLEPIELPFPGLGSLVQDRSDLLPGVFRGPAHSITSVMCIFSRIRITLTGYQEGPGARLSLRKTQTKARGSPRRARSSTA